MFKLFKKRELKKDPILEMIERQTQELKEIRDRIRKSDELLDRYIEEAEKLLKQKGYTEEDLERIRQQVKLEVISKD